MSIYGFKENHCKEEVMSKTDIISKYQLKGNQVIQDFENGKISIDIQNDTIYKLLYKSNVTSCNININIQGGLSVAQKFNSTVIIQTGKISPSVSVSVNNGLLIPMDGTPIPMALKSKMIYKIDFYFDGFCMCYNWTVHGFSG